MVKCADCGFLGRAAGIGAINRFEAATAQQREHGLPPSRITHWRKIVTNNGGLTDFDELVNEALDLTPVATDDEPI